MQTLRDEASGLMEFTRAVRRDLHQHPEIAFEEYRTAAKAALELNSFGFEVATGIAQTGVVGLLEGNQAGPVVMARFDMDALPIHEENTVVYTSQTPGRMHACGHDGHVAVGLTVARLLARRKERLAGSLKFIFQPAEEGLGGAEKMIEEGVLEKPRPDRVIAMHLWNERPVGWIGVVPGPMMAGSEIFTVKVSGKGGHGAMPNQAIDPILASAHIVTALQSIVSRNVPPLDGAVVSVTRISAGETFNVIPPSVEILGTIRTFKPEVRKLVIERFEQIVSAVAEGMGCQAEIQVKLTTPPVVNDPDLTSRVQNLVREQFPDLKLDTTFQSMVSEDMAFIMEKVPGCYLLVGSANHENGLDYSHHHPCFDFDENALPIAAAVMSAAILALFAQ